MIIYPKWIKRIYFNSDPKEKIFDDYVDRNEFKDFIERINWYNDIGFEPEDMYLDANYFNQLKDDYEEGNKEE